MFIKEHSTEAKKTDMHVSQYVMTVLSVNVMGLVDLVFINKTKFTWAINLSCELLQCLLLVQSIWCLIIDINREIMYIPACF